MAAEADVKDAAGKEASMLYVDTQAQGEDSLTSAGVVTVLPVWAMILSWISLSAVVILWSEACFSRVCCLRSSALTLHAPVRLSRSTYPRGPPLQLPCHPYDSPSPLSNAG